MHALLRRALLSYTLRRRSAKLREKWNCIQNKLGYVDTYTDRMSAEIHTFTDYYNRYINQADSATAASPNPASPSVSSKLSPEASRLPTAKSSYTSPLNPLPL